MSTTSMGKRPTNGLPSVVVGEGYGVNLTGLRVFMDGEGCLRGGGEGLLGENDMFLACR